GAVWPSDPQQGLRMLEDPGACPPDLRCFSWGVLYAQCKRYRASLAGHTAAVTAVAASPDGRHFATGATDGQVRPWDLATGEPRRRRSRAPSARSQRPRGGPPPPARTASYWPPAPTTA